MYQNNKEQFIPIFNFKMRTTLFVIPLPNLEVTRKLIVRTDTVSQFFLSRLKKLRVDNAAESEIMKAYFQLESVKKRLREVIISQGAWIRKIKKDKAAESEIEEAVKRQVSLKADYKAATGSEWSEVREEGPILLTTNKVKGREILPELRERLKEMRRENVIR